MVSRVIPVAPFDLVLFGATGDLAKRKILPGLFHRFAVGQVPPASQIIGTARADLSRDAFINQIKQALVQGSQIAKGQPAQLQAFLQMLDYVALDVQADSGWDDLKQRLSDDHVSAFYLSVTPALFAPIAHQLKEHALAGADSRIVVEKPFGRDLATAQGLNADLSRDFDEHQIYRIDHYLGKETVQNLMALRFANSLWEPLWNATHIDHVQITVGESLGVAGRGAYYDSSGAMRDMVQNHLMQLLCLTAMEPPPQLNARAVRDQKLKVIEALQPVAQSDLVRGQYRASAEDGSYHDHVEQPASRTESYIALKVNIANWRWAGTPFYLRTGKKLRARCSEIVVQFRAPPHTIFPGQEAMPGNALIIRLQPDEGITLRTTIKEPGPGGMRLTEAALDMTFAQALGPDVETQDAYERLIMDVIRGDQTLFMRSDEVEAAWSWADPIIAGWQDSGARPVLYDAGSSGPEDALMLMHRDGRRWREIDG
jgi:glucose-6-phosphate 1-dehydrogenase